MAPPIFGIRARPSIAHPGPGTSADTPELLPHHAGTDVNLAGAVPPAVKMRHIYTFIDKREMVGVFPNSLSMKISSLLQDFLGTSDAGWVHILEINDVVINKIAASRS